MSSCHLLTQAHLHDVMHLTSMLCSVARMLELKICNTTGHTENAILWKRGERGDGGGGYSRLRREDHPLEERGERGGGRGEGGGTVGYTESVIMGEGRGIVGYTENASSGREGSGEGEGTVGYTQNAILGERGKGEGERVNLVTYTPADEVERTNLPWFLGHRAWLLLSTWL